ncbi:type VI secretion protein [Streptomyces sp. NPDC012510]|uniref:type VI secretion protein n=1 Tax=Streptomyces sp. NPDC012510 TaxID=3364838 RepID=UPI0036E6472E
MRPDDRRDRRTEQGGGGVPDGLLIALLGFLVGLTVLVWSATGLAGLFAHGAWPDHVTFARTPLAVRSLVSDPQNLPAAWPDTPAGHLSGYGLFWGLVIGQLMILLVLTVFVMGTLARWRTVRATQKAARAQNKGTAAPAPPTEHPGPTTPHTGTPATPHTGSHAQNTDPTADGPTAPTTPPRPHAGGHARHGTTAAAHGHPTAPAPPHPETPTQHGTQAQRQAYAHEARLTTTADAPGQPAPPAPAHPVSHSGGLAPPAGFPAAASIPSTPVVPEPRHGTPSAAFTSATEAGAAAPFTPGAPHPGGWAKATPTVVLGPAESRRPAAAQAVRDAEGPALVVTSDPALWSDTKDARAKLGPVLLYDPAHRCDTPARLHWSPVTGCEDKPTALARAIALLAPIRPTARIDQAMADTAETLLRSYLHAAAIDSRTIRHLHRWAQGSNVQEAVRILRTNPKAVPGAAGELESALTSHPERRDIAQQLTARALSALSTVNVRESCTPNRADSLVLDSFVHEGGTLYVVGDPIEDPKANPSAMPLLTALASSVVERGRRMAERSSSGRLDPPLTLVLDDVAAVAPLPQLPALLSGGLGQGLPTLALLRSREQARSRWPNDELPLP